MSIGIAFSFDWHTTPDKWKEERNFHSVFDAGYENRIIIGHKYIKNNIKNKIISPNKAYWFAAKPRPLENLEKDGLYGINFAAFTPNKPIYVFNERNYLIEIKPSKDDPDYHLRKINWINEKLLYIEVWWGSVLGTYFIFDVEKEQIVIREMVNDGVIPFMQWQQVKQK